MDEDQYTEAEYTCVRELAKLFKQFQMLIAESPRARNVDVVLEDVKKMSLEDLDEF